MELKKMKDYSDRELLELIMTSQAHIMNRLSVMAKRMKYEDPNDQWDPEKEVIGEGMWETVNVVNELNNQIDTMMQNHQGSGE